MADFTIYCDDLQEGIWFQELDPHFENAELEVIPSKKAEIMSCGLDEVLKYDRPDIILKDENNVIFVLERTVEGKCKIIRRIVLPQKISHNNQ